jgi:hypothetical protein
LRDHRARSFVFLALLLLFLPSAAQAALTPLGAPFAIADESPCTFDFGLEVMSTPKGAFEVVWADSREQEVKGRRFGRNQEPTGPPLTLKSLGAIEIPFDFKGFWAAGFYELAMMLGDFGENPADPLVAYRAQLDLEGDLVVPPVRVKTPRIVHLAPAARGDSLLFRFEPPYFGPLICQSRGLLVRRIDAGRNPLSVDSRVNRGASAWVNGYLAVDRLPNDTFVAAYSTCQKFVGVVARRLNAAGAPVGKPINLPLPGQVGNYAGRNLALAASGTDFAVAAMVSGSSADISGAYTLAVVNGRVFGPTRISSPPGLLGLVVADLAASPAGGYLLLAQAASGDPLRHRLFAYELDVRGVPKGEPLEIAAGNLFGVEGAVASLPDGRWIVVTRAQRGEELECTERLVGTILTSVP